MGEFPSGQREQTVNLSSLTSVVRIHPLPPKRHCFLQCLFSFICAILKSGFERTDGSERQAKLCDKRVVSYYSYSNHSSNIRIVFLTYLRKLKAIYNLFSKLFKKLILKSKTKSRKQINVFSFNFIVERNILSL